MDRVKTIRARLTLLGTLLLLVGLTMGAVAFDRLLAYQLVDNIDQSLRVQAIDKALAVDEGTDPVALMASVQGETGAAVFAADGQLLASQGLARPQQLADVAPGPAVEVEIDLVEVDERETERTRVRAIAARPAEALVVIAAETEQIDSTLGAARTLLGIGVPLLSLIGGVLLWSTTGRALRPVEQLRSDAQTIVDIGSGGRLRQPIEGEPIDEVGRLALTLNNMLDRLDSSASVLRQFVSDASHEIRSPVTNIRARLETSDASQWSEVRTDVIGEIERVEALIGDLTYLARSDEGQVELRPATVEIDSLLFAEASRVQQRGLVSVDASRVEPVFAQADELALGRVIRNLVDNAERHAKGRIRIGSTETDGSVRITVEDDGPGIPTEDRERVFSRFVRLDGARGRDSGGTGLGLAIVADVVQRLGGRSRIETSADLGGASAVVEVPKPPRR